MNQIVSFMKEMIPLVMNGTKNLTTRIETPFRLKLDIEDKMYIYSGIITKNAKKHGEAIIVNRWYWNQARLLIVGSNCPISGFSWLGFALCEGFKKPIELKQWFSKKSYENKNLITYQFELIK